MNDAIDRKAKDDRLGVLSASGTCRHPPASWHLIRIVLSHISSLGPKNDPARGPFAPTASHPSFLPPPPEDRSTIESHRRRRAKNALHCSKTPIFVLLPGARWSRFGTKLQQIDQIAIAGLPDTIQFAPGSLSIRCRNMEHLVDQLVLLAKALDSDYEGMRLRVESAPAPNP